MTAWEETKRRILMFGIPLLMICDGITTYIGVKHYDIPEGNPLMIPIAGTVQGMIISIIFAILFFRMLILDYKLGTINHGIVKTSYWVIFLFYLLFQASNITGILLQ